MNSLLFRCNKNKVVILLLITVVLLASYSVYNSKIDNSGNSNLSVWSKEYVLTYNNHNYVVTDQSTNEVNQVIGTVTYHGNKPGCFRLFSIKQEEGLQKIAIETRSGYLIAIREQ